MKLKMTCFLLSAAAFSCCVFSAQAQTASPRLGVSAASILKQCLDPGPLNLRVGPSARARECTRQYCSQPAYQAKLKAYAMSKPQSELDAEQALTCITRWEQDQKHS